MTPEAAPRTAAAKREARRRVLDRMTHEEWCEWHPFGKCACEAGQVFIDALAIEAEAAQPATPVGALDVEAHHRFSVPDCDWCRAVRASLDADLAAASEPAAR